MDESGRFHTPFGDNWTVPMSSNLHAQQKITLAQKCKVTFYIRIYIFKTQENESV